MVRARRRITFFRARAMSMSNVTPTTLCRHVRRVVKEHQLRPRTDDLDLGGAPPSGSTTTGGSTTGGGGGGSSTGGRATTASQAELERRFFLAGDVLVSPLTRAIQTALIGLPSHPTVKRRGLKLMREIREVRSSLLRCVVASLRRAWL